MQNERDPAECTLEVLQKRWTVRIIAALSEGELHFLALLRRIPRLHHKVLIEHLRFLVQHGVIARSPPQSGGRVTYRLTAHGAALLTIIAQMRAWPPGIGSADQEQRGECDGE